MSRYYVDASVIAGLVLSDIDVDPIIALVGDQAGLTYSDFGFGEVVSAISARARAKRLSDPKANSLIAALVGYLEDWQEVLCLSADLARAAELTGRASLALKFSDAIHCAIAERIGLPLLTIDRQQYNAAQKLGIPAFLPMIGK